MFRIFSSLFNHEFGHAVPQTLVFGPLHWLVVGIPSLIRCWWWSARVDKGLPVPEYDSIWFERTATEWGNA